MEAKPKQFPLSLPALGFIVFAFYTLARTTLAVDISPNVSAKAGILSQFLIGGLVLAVLSAFILDRSFQNIMPAKGERVGLGLTTNQALVSVAGFAGLGLFQLIVNQYSLSPLLLNATPISKEIFGIDAGIAEEAVFSAFLTMVIYRVLLRTLGNYLDVLAAGLITAALVGVGFVDWHGFVYGTNQQALLFVFGSRVILVGVFLYTKSLAVVMLLHATWNYLSFVGPCPLGQLGFQIPGVSC